MVILVSQAKVYLKTLIIISIISYMVLFIYIHQDVLLYSTTHSYYYPTTSLQSCTNIPLNLLNISNFKFHKISKICTKWTRDHRLRDHPSIIIIVHSAIKNFMRRDTIRSTWGSIKRYKKWTIELVFLLGLDLDSNISLGTRNSSSGKHNRRGPPPDHNYTDIVIGNFIDSPFLNLSYKHLMGYKWVLEHCTVAQYIVKVDDDVALDLFHLIKIIEETELNNTNSTSQVSIIGNLMSRNKEGRNLTEATYPDYVSGLGYVIRPEAACEVLKAQNSVQFLPMLDDVFVTGVLREKLNLTIKDIKSEYIYEPSPQFLSWYNNITTGPDNTILPPPWTFILADLPQLDSSHWEIVGNIWFQTMRSYNFSPGHGFNE